MIFMSALLQGGSPAQAAACCSSASMGGVGRLKMWEKFAIGANLTYSDSQGSWDELGEYFALSEGYDEQLSSLKPWVIGRVNERLEVSLLTPLVTTSRQIGDEQARGVGLGHVELNSRYELLAIGAYQGLPGIALHLGVTLPTGTRPDQSYESPLMTATTAKGSWASSLSMDVEYVKLPWIFKWDSGVRLFAPYVQGGMETSFALGALYQTSLLLGYEPVEDRLLVALSVAYSHQGNNSLDGEPLDGSEVVTVTPSLALSWKLSAHWGLVSSLGQHPLASGYGKNTNGGAQASMGLRYGHF